MNSIVETEKPVGWVKYPDLEPAKRLRNEGRELLGQLIWFTEKRDGENVSLSLDLEGAGTIISSHNQEIADDDIQSRFVATPEFEKAENLLIEQAQYRHHLVLYGELLKTVSPTRIEPRRKHVHWVLFDIYDLDEKRFWSWNQCYMICYHHHIPFVQRVTSTIPASLEDLQAEIKQCLKWCRRHRREGVVGKVYENPQIFFKEKIDLPELPKIPRPGRVELPVMDEHTCLRALQHAFDEVGEEKWKDRAVVMPIVAKHFGVEAREHNFDTPRNMYQLYLETPVEKLVVKEVLA